MEVLTLLDNIVDIAEKAGHLILAHYESDKRIITKNDLSPLTNADIESNNFIIDQLTKLTPDIPIISEETLAKSYTERQSWRTFWLVDPLDGTKEFIQGTGYFTVNIALISNGEPVLGVIEVPVLKEVYFAANREAYILDRKKMVPPRRLNVRKLDTEQCVIVASRDHSGPAVQAICNKLSQAKITSIGSSLKFCLIADGKADFYLRDGNTMEWDTAAAHAILQAEGGDIYTVDGLVLTYNKETLTNSHILSFGSDPDFWFKLYES